MVLRKKLSCLWTLGLCLVASKSSAKVPAITDQHFKDECVESHNELRGKVWPPAADMKHMVRKNGSGIFFSLVHPKVSLGNKSDGVIYMNSVWAFTRQLTIMS